jgi:hypothetical protein
MKEGKGRKRGKKFNNMHYIRKRMKRRDKDWMQKKRKVKERRGRKQKVVEDEEKKKVR